MLHAKLLSPYRSALLVVCSLTALAACGGGDGTGSPSNAPTPIPSPVRPIEPPGPPRSTAEIILRDGDRMPDGLVVTNIEDAAFAAGRVAALISSSNTGGARAIVLREPGAGFATAFDPRAAAPEIDARSLSRIRMSPTGEIVFRSGNGLDSDRLHLLQDGVVYTLAGAEPGPVFPDFRILGNVRIEVGGIVAFVGGGQACEVTPGSEEPRIVCTNALYVADANGVVRLDDSELDLEGQRPIAIRVEMDPHGGAWFSLPRRRTAPVLLHHAAGTTNVVLDGASELDGVGAINSVEVVGVNAASDVLLEVSQQAFEGERRPTTLGVLREGSFVPYAKEGTTLGGMPIATIRGIGIDEAGRALFEAALGSPDEPGRAAPSLWYGDENGLVEIVREGAPFPGESSIVVDLQGSRVNQRGDVAFITRLGTVSGGTVRVEEVRATVRRAEGHLVNIASSRNTAQLGEITALVIGGFDREGSLVLIASRSRSSDRVLLLGRSDGATD